MPRLPRFAVLFLALPASLAFSCKGFDGGLLNPSPASEKPQRAACPDVSPGRFVLNKAFVASGPVDAKLKTYVQASNDLAAVAAQAELEIAQACTRIGLDLGVAGNFMQPRQENGGRATGACFPAANALEAMNRQGAGVLVRATQPFCTPNQMAQNQCGQSCTLNLNDAECAASCRVHGDVYATCTPALVVVTPTNANPLSFRVAATLQANLPNLLHAETALARRLGSDALILGQVGGNLPGQVGASGALAQGCVTDGAAQAQSASWLLQTAIRASTQITARVGATSG